MILVTGLHRSVTCIHNLGYPGAFRFTLHPPCPLFSGKTWGLSGKGKLWGYPISMTHQDEEEYARFREAIMAGIPFRTDSPHHEVRIVPMRISPPPMYTVHPPRSVLRDPDSFLASYSERERRELQEYLSAYILEHFSERSGFRGPSIMNHQDSLGLSTTQRTSHPSHDTSHTNPMAFPSSSTTTSPSPCIFFCMWLWQGCGQIFRIVYRGWLWCPCQKSSRPTGTVV